MDIIPVILGTVKYNKIIKSRIPSNAPHALVPLKRSKRWYRNEDYASILFLHDFAGGVNLFFGTPEFRKVKCSDKQLQTPTKTTVLQREVAISQEKQLKSACNDWSGGAVSMLLFLVVSFCSFTLQFFHTFLSQLFLAFSSHRLRTLPFAVFP